ncbi:MAG TPA: Gldg family protein [Bacteroidales bacterium]|nr:Gldg family protein [Bacteroidales bacterium]HPR13248.1 Gldg family protein [Bacteroidales bacterium]HRW84712.1 Gldg family protein [Bacteroidales bacterium]
MMNKTKISTTILLVAAIIVIVNILSENYFFRIDFTEGKEYTLSKATRDILKNLEEPVTVTAYFSKDLPPNIASISGNLKDMLSEYGSRSKGMVVYRFVNPNEKETSEEEAVKAGIQPVMINVREKDQVKQQKAYLGAVVSTGNEKETIPFFRPGSAMEYSLSTAIKKLTVKDKSSIAFILGHGEPDLNEMMQVYTDLSVLYNVEAYSMSDTVGIPEKFKTLALVRPVDTIPREHLEQLDNFLSRGGNIVLAVNRVEGDFTTATGRPVGTGLEDWLSSKGIAMTPSFIIDANCGVVNVQQQQGNFIMQSQVSFPYFPVINRFSDNPAVKGLESVAMQFASPISYSGDSTKIFTPLAYSSEQSGTVNAPLYFDVSRQWTQNDFPLKGQVVAGVLEGRLSGQANSRMIIIADGDFAVSGRERGAQVPPDNSSLLVNSIDWLSDDSGLIDLRTKEVTSRPVKELPDGVKSFLKWLNFILPVILILIYGLVRIQINRTRKIKRMEVNYE